MGLFAEFKEFLQEYKVAALAVAFVTGLAVNNLVQSIVNDLIMPLITPFVPLGGWKEATLTLGPVVLRWGSFLSSFIYFLIIMLVIFLTLNSLKLVNKKKK
ncbi:MAG: MscL family protein [Nanoarchaeota archaeon]|nr:MscL family protein [Nanoarchaeota archaeon]